MMSNIATPALSTPEQSTEAGRQALQAQNYEHSIECFGIALRLAVEVANGQEDAPECAPYYARYGKALLEAAIESTCLLNETAIKPTSTDMKTDNRVMEFSDDDSSEDGCEDAGAEDKQDNEAADADEEETSDFDLAWQMLDMARLLYSRQQGPSSRVQEAAVLEDLADLSMELELFAQAISDYQEAVAVLKTSGIEDKRSIAALSFKLGMALEYSGNVEKGIEALSEAHSIISSLVSREDPLDPKGKQKASEDELALIQKEIEQKLEEMRSGKTLGSQANLREAMASASVPVNAPVNDLSGLIVKKRRTE